ncbi:MAG: iron-containing alcohol dehydrogenase, partial [Casimicrobiaceae bacterium]
EAVRALARTLILSGIGMTLCGGSHPASQGEHLISHYLDMRSPLGRAGYLHGEQVAVATLTMARIQETMLAGTAPALAATAVDLPALQQHFGAELGTECWHDFAPKRLDSERARALSASAQAKWPALVEQANAVRIPSSQLATVMRRAGGPTAPADIGADPAFYWGAVGHARYLRDRFTFLDLAGDAGLLEGQLFS